MDLTMDAPDTIATAREDTNVYRDAAATVAILAASAHALVAVFGLTVAQASSVLSVAVAAGVMLRLVKADTPPTLPWFRRED